MTPLRPHMQVVLSALLALLFFGLLALAVGCDAAAPSPDGAEGEAEAEAEGEDASVLPLFDAAGDGCASFTRIECECALCGLTGCYREVTCRWQDGECRCTFVDFIPRANCAPDCPP